MDEVKIVWTTLARRERDAIFDYWNKKNKSNHYSKKLNLIIYQKIDLLKSNPLLALKPILNRTEFCFLRITDWFIGQKKNYFISFLFGIIVKILVN
jgi:hypothetical protein